MSNPTITRFFIMYDGESHQDHDIDIKTLGNSLNALGEILFEANEIINRQKDTIEVKVKADFVRGSFGVEIDLFQHLVNAKDILVPLGLSAATGSVLAIIDWLRGRDITIIESEEEHNIIVCNDERMTCSKEVSAMVTNQKIRKSLEKMIKEPLVNPGTSSFYVKSDRDSEIINFEVDKERAKAFVSLPIREHVETITCEARIKFIAANIKNKTGWKIEYNSKEESAKMNDEFFQERLLNMEEPHIFGRTFNVELKIEKTRILGQEKIKLSIETVHHESSEIQLSVSTIEATIPDNNDSMNNEESKVPQEI